MRQRTELHLRISENLKQKFQEFCQKNDTSVSEEIKKLMEKYLEKNGIEV